MAGTLTSTSAGDTITISTAGSSEPLAAGAGTGCLVTWSGSAWQIAGTNATVAA